ncbi:MAG TPA: hypothetical protein VHT05_05365 [Candidatus Elarobacter sp.]|nr:hypothetical protein [Candidatus Elarobacter sp.]
MVGAEAHPLRPAPFARRDDLGEERPLAGHAQQFRARIRLHAERRDDRGRTFEPVAHARHAVEAFARGGRPKDAARRRSTARRQNDIGGRTHRAVYSQAASAASR